ncbi:hypothetical protein L6164_034051 [Bauhinia variegata]|uniref:Uncharacterized protein n=1 Tax=Bauhinia variegata TaxID=167791 RepID=A0ACB9KU15_BAUVA|nr:hypothetical protein L6164_034051 [Bauhinia variegata]
MYASQWRFVKELSSVANVRGSSEEFSSFQATKAPCSVLTHLQTSPAFSSTKTLLTFEPSEHQIKNIPGFSSEFQKKIDPEIVFCQSHGDNFINNTQLDESFWSSYDDSFNHVQFQGHNMPFYEHFSEDSKLPEENDTTATIVGSWLPASISSQRNRDNHDKHSSGPSGAGGISSSSSNYVSRTVSKGKRRIRWTKDLHELFITIVDRLGGPQKAKPKEILKMMGSDELSISHIKSHLQNYRSTIHMQKALQEGHVDKHRRDGITELQLKIQMQIEESRQLQLEVERSLKEQLEMQRNMQVLIEQQKKQLFIITWRTTTGHDQNQKAKENPTPMEDLKKRKLDEAGNGDFSSKEELRLLLDPLTKPQLVDLLAKLGSKYPSIAEEIKSIASADPVHRKLFVRGLAWNTTSETLCAVFQEHGEIEEGAVIYDKATGRSRGYGFITYKHMESTHRALRAPGKLIDGRMAVCNLACEGLTGASNAADLSLRKLYVGSLSPEVTSEMLLHFFGRHGEIEEGSAAYDKDTNESRGFGFVTYKTAEAAKKAIDDPEKTLGGRNIIVKYADSKNKTGQAPLTGGVTPMAAVPMAPGYMQPGRSHIGAPPVGYAYPQTVPPYPPASYPSPPTAPVPYYPMQGQVSYPPVSVKKDSLGPQPAPPVGMSNYPYYYPKQ